MEHIFSSNLSRLRKARGLTQTEAATGLGLTRNTYANYETGHSEPGLTKLASIASFFGISLDALITFPIPDGKLISEEEGAKNPKIGKVKGKEMGKVNGENGGFQPDQGGYYDGGQGSINTPVQPAQPGDVFSDLLTHLAEDRQTLLRILENVTRSATATDSIHGHMGHLRADVAEIKARVVL